MDRLAAKPLTGIKPRSIPVIHCSDLLHPHDDPDDHFDLATLYAMPELDLKAVILDQGQIQVTNPGTVPVSQMNHLTGRRVSAAIGLGEKLRSPDDKGLDQDTRYQGGVELMLKVLRQSRKPVMITAVGSMRDVAAAFNREPGLFRRKVSKLLIFIGEASNPEFQEWNVSLDPLAYVTVMRSGLPVYWVPCFDGGLWKNHGHASYWQIRHADILVRVRPEVLQFFVYMLEKEVSDPLGYLETPVDPQKKARWLPELRNLWCTAVFGALANQVPSCDGGRYALVPMKDGRAPGALFGFSQVEVSVSDTGVVTYGKTATSKTVQRFEILDPARYAEGMTAVTADLLAGLEVVSAGGNSRKTRKAKD